MNVVSPEFSPVLEVSESEGPKSSPEGSVYLRPKATLLRIQEPAWHPPVDVFEMEDAYVVKVELAGMSKEEISVIVDCSTLTITGCRNDSSGKEKLRYRQMEIKYGVFAVCLRLPEDVDVDAVEAVYKNGFLESRLPRKTEAPRLVSKVTIQIG
jgi:HSP20 family protein